MIPSGMRSNDDNHELEQVAPGLWAVKNAYKGEYVFGADFPRKEKKMIEGLDSFLQKKCKNFTAKIEALKVRAEAFGFEVSLIETASEDPLEKDKIRLSVRCPDGGYLNEDFDFSDDAQFFLNGWMARGGLIEDQE